MAHGPWKEADIGIVDSGGSPVIGTDTCVPCPETTHTVLVLGDDDAAGIVALRNAAPALLAEVERLRTELQTAAQCNAANILELHRADQLIGELKAERKDALEGLATVAGVNGYSPEESFPRAIRTDNRFRATVEEVVKLRDRVLRAEAELAGKVSTEHQGGKPQ
jgi:hypothetical protein